MELPIFLVALLIVLAYLARNQVYGRGRTQRDRDAIEANRAVGYGATLAPPGTSPAASVNAPWFERTHGEDRPQSHGPGE